MKFVEILIILLIAGAIYYIIRQIPKSKDVGLIGLKKIPRGKSFYSKNRFLVIGTMFANLGNAIVSGFMSGWEWITGLFGKKKIGNFKTKKKPDTAEEDLSKQLKKPEDRAFWIEEEGQSQDGGTAHLIAKTYFEQAEEAFSRKDYRKAETLFLEAAREKPNDSKIFNRLGVIYLEYRKFDEAVEAFEAALKYDGNVASRHFNLALALMGQGNFLQAKNSLENAVRLAPENDKYRKVLEEIAKKC